MLKITDKDTKVINKNQLKTLKCKSVSPLKFIAPPKQILDALQHVNNLLIRQEFIILELQNEIDAANKLNKNSLSLQKSLMQESCYKLNMMLRRIVKHLVTHKFSGINVIARYAHPNQPNIKNWYEVSINGDPFYLNLTTKKNCHIYNAPFKGTFEPKYILEKPRTFKSKLMLSEAVCICESYNYAILKKHMRTKDLNHKISTHNRLAKLLKVRVQQGLVTLVKDT